jgi:hypothetical protein
MGWDCVYLSPFRFTSPMLRSSFPFRLIPSTSALFAETIRSNGIAWFVLYDMFKRCFYLPPFRFSYPSADLVRSVMFGPVWLTSALVRRHTLLVAFSRWARLGFPSHTGRCLIWRNRFVLVLLPFVVEFV